MTESPERIWIASEQPAKVTEYIRADIAEEIAAGSQRLMKDVERLESLAIYLINIAELDVGIDELEDMIETREAEG